MDSDTKYKIESTSRDDIELMLNANKMSLALYDILGWQSAIYNGKNYGEGCVFWKGKLYDKHEWEMLKHTEDDYDKETNMLKEQPVYLYKEDEVERKLDDLTHKIRNIIYDYYE